MDVGLSHLFILNPKPFSNLYVEDLGTDFLGYTKVKVVFGFSNFKYLRKIPSIFLRLCSNLLKSKHSLRKIEGIFLRLIRKPLSL
jgi:hypothetical protein